MPSADTQFTRDNLPSRKGLEPNTREVAKTPIGVRLYAEDVQRLSEVKDRSGFIRDAVHRALHELRVPMADRDGRMKAAPSAETAGY